MCRQTKLRILSESREAGAYFRKNVIPFLRNDDELATANQSLKKNLDTHFQLIVITDIPKNISENDFFGRPTI